MDLRRRFPLVEPNAIHHLAVSPLHTLYIEEIGNPQGMPVVFLHGGPGIGTLPHYRQLFDPEKFHVFLYSQRGAYPSTPVGELHENDTWYLVEDLDKIRRHFGIEQWVVFGGSWGSTLALTYAIRHPERAAGLVLRGIFLGAQSELDWMYRDGASRIYPEEWERFLAPIPLSERGDLVSAYYSRLTSANYATRLEYARAWCTWENSIIRLIPRPPKEEEDDNIIAFARIECHYMINRLFFPSDSYLLDHLEPVSHIPVWIAQGRYDIICPVVAALELSRRLANCRLNIIPDAGHSIIEPGIASSLIEGIETLADQYWS
jgi:proline iminopeptidase